MKLLRAGSAKALKQLKKIREIVLPGDGGLGEPIGRFAPSVLMRSENEIFGLSVPRFAIRVYLSGSHGSFVNLRRVAELTERVDGVPLVRLSGLEIDLTRYALDDSVKLLSQVMLGIDPERLVHVADALLEPPAKLVEDFHILTVDLGREYGEAHPVFGTPFAAPLSGIGGGKCAQAAIFMASALLLGMPQQDREEWPRICVHGPGEVTAILSRASMKKAWSLKGLTVNQIRRYFEETERSCLVQVNERDRELMSGGSRSVLESVMRAYLRSGVPILLPVDHKRLDQKDPKSVRLPETDHCVVVVGYNCGGEVSGFVVNNPSKYPFATHDGERLWQSCDTADQINSDDLGRTICVPLPRKVRFSIETLTKDVTWRGHEEKRMGLIELAMLLQRENIFNQSRGVRYAVQPSDSEFEVGELALARLGGAGRESHRFLVGMDLLEESDRKSESLALCWEEAGRYWPGRWCYVQYRNGINQGDRTSLWVWDAERPMEARPWWEQETEVDGAKLIESAEEQVLAVFERESEGPWRIVHPWGNMPERQLAGGRERLDAIRNRTESVQGIISASQNLELSLITSFSTESTRQALRSWRGEIKQSRLRDDKELLIDLFAFMPRDSILSRLSRTLGLEGSATSLEVLSEAFGRDDLIENVARRIDGFCLPKRNRAGLRVGAMATFLPDITAQDEGRRRKGIRATACCVKLAEALLGLGHPVGAIEVVCGSRVIGLGRAKHLHDDGAAYFAIPRDEEETIRGISQSLNEVVKLTGLWKVGEGEKCRCPLAVELEPGPLNAMDHPDRLVKLAKALKGTPAWNSVGFNADLAHFYLSGAEPEEFEHGEYKTWITDRIVHGHVSDHGPGVFGDLSLAPEYVSIDKTGRTWLKRWMRLLNRISADRGPRAGKTHGLPYTGLVSLELEAVRSVRMISESYGEFENWFK